MIDIRSAAIIEWEKDFTVKLTVLVGYDADYTAIRILIREVQFISIRERDGGHNSVTKWKLGFPDDSLIPFGEWVARCLVQKAILRRVKGIGEKRQASVIAAMKAYTKATGGL